MRGPDLSRPDPVRCVHRRLRLDLVDLHQSGVAVAICTGSSTPLSSVARALRFPAYYGANWDAMEECLRDLADWWPAAGWVLEVDGARGNEWPRLEECWRAAAQAHAAAGRSLHLVYR